MLRAGRDFGKLLVQGAGKDISLAKSWVVGILLTIALVLVLLFIGSMEVTIQGERNPWTGQASSVTTTIRELGELGSGSPTMFYIGVVIFASIPLASPISKAIYIPQTVINVYEKGIQGRGASKLLGSFTKTSEFMLPYSQLSIDLRGEELTIAAAGVKYYVYAVNGKEIQQTIFQQISTKD